MNILIKNGRVIDPASKTDQIADVWIKNGKIKQIVQGELAREQLSSEILGQADMESVGSMNSKVIDASGCFVMPGFIDLHVHLRDPGYEYKETVETGIKAAIHGGFTTILAMPNTKPVADNVDVVNYVHNKAENIGLARVLQIGAITKGQHGEILTDIEDMVEAGIPAISEDGKTVMNSKLYREAMALALKCDIPVFAHCEDKELVAGGVMNAGKKAEELGLPGITNAVEDIIVSRDILLAKETGARLHVCHCSTLASVAMVEAAKKQGVKVTAEVCPHHFILSEEDIQADDGNFKMNPPLRSKEDVEALREALKHDVVEVIATDHAPHSHEEKCNSMRYAAFGIVGLETAAALTMTELVEKGYLTPMQMAEKMSYNPAKIIGLDRGSLELGKAADVVIFNPAEEYTIDGTCFRSKSKNTPFQGKAVKGRVKATIVGGYLVYSHLDAYKNSENDNKREGI